MVPAYNVEKYLRGTLDSLVDQTFNDFEAIIVNDGSTDSTQEIIEEYCSKYDNFKFIYQENQGLAGARNTGIKNANGQFLGFLDGDDKYPDDALKYFNETIEKSISSKGIPDIVIGQQVLTTPWRRYSYANAKILSELDFIEPINRRIIWTMSMCNKVFLRETVIKLNNLVPLVSYAEDGAFLLPLVYKSNLIVGCPHEIYYYQKRTSEDYSISQTPSLKMLKAYFQTHKIIYEAFIDFIQKKKKELGLKGIDLEKIELNESNLEVNTGKSLEFKINYLNYLDHLIYRQCSILITQLYLFFWRAEDEVILEVVKTINKFRTEMISETWEKTKRKNKFIDLENLITNKKEMAENPLISIVIDIQNINSENLERLINNIYNSSIPYFEILISSESLSNNSLSTESLSSESSNESLKINKEIINRRNFHILESNGAEFRNEALNSSKGKYFILLDNEVFLSPDFLKYCLKNLKYDETINKDNITVNKNNNTIDSDEDENNESIDFLSIKMFPLKDNNLTDNNFDIFDFSPQNLIFHSKKSISQDKYNYLDFYFVNKVISKEFLKREKFHFTEDSKKDIEFLYGQGNFKKLKGKHILSLSERIKNPLITVAIDDMNINKKDFNELIESIYNQSFKSFEIVINKNLLSLLEDEFLNEEEKNENSKQALKFIENEDFKE
ncbi:MAG: glycosyltransferase family 2 protein, partial [Methanobrevibacter sp.]|nr:glycosyltransferase family 2 protein [Methanobrevibacter sp.]